MISEYPNLRLILFLGLLGLMFFIETYWPTRSWLDRRSDRVKFSIKLAVVNNLIMRLFIAVPFIGFAHWVSSNGWGISKFLGLSGLLEIIATVVLFDFFDALKHKWFHRVAFMWRFHRVHHTDRTLDILTALRYHPGELFISVVIKAGWILVWGPSMVAFTIFEIVLNMASEFHHSNIGLGRWDPGLNKVLVTPKYHAIHHTINREKGDQNFTTIFSVWDRLLGTYASPETTLVNLERLGTLQDQHLSLVEVLKSPLISPTYNGEERFEPGRADSDSEFKDAIYSRAKEKLRGQQAVLVDVREQSERQREGELEQAVWFPYSANDAERIQQIKDVAQGRDVHVFCRAGVRAQKVCDQLDRIGVQAVNLGGFGDCLEHDIAAPLTRGVDQKNQRSVEMA